MDEELLFLATWVVLAAVVAGAVALFLRLRRVERDRDLLARRLTQLERAFREERPLRPPPAPTAPSAALPPAAPVHVPPAEDDYAAAEAELRADETSERAVAEPAVPVAAQEERAAPTSPEVPAPRAHGLRERLRDGPLAPRGERRPAAFSLEDFLGGRVLLVVGVIVVLFALGFFLKYAIEQELIEPPVRVAIGVLSGLVALVGGDLLRRRGFDVFGHAVMGGGLGALFLSTFFAATRYGLIDQPVAFGITAAVALAGVVVSLRREAPLLAYLGFVGGYIAPTILGEGKDALEGLTGWLLALHVGVLVVLWLRRWPGLDLLALASSGAYYFLWADRYAFGPRLSAAAWSLAALTTLVLAVSLAPGVLRRRPIMPTSLVAAIVAGAASVTAGFELFHRDHPYALGGAILGLALVYALSARRAVGRVRDLALDAPTLDGCAVAAVGAAIPTFLEGAALAPAWAAAGAVAVFLAGARRSALVLVCGLAMIVLAQIDLLDKRHPMHDGPFVPFANGAFISWVAPSVALVISGLLLRWRSPWRQLSGFVLGAGAWAYAPVLVAEVVIHILEDPATYGAGHEELAAAAAVAALAIYTVVLALLVRSRRAVAILLPLGPLVAASLFALPVLLFMDRADFVPLANAQFLAGAALVAAWWVSTWSARGALRVVLLIGSVIAGLVLIGGECVAYGENASTVGTSRDALERVALVWMSVTFAIYAATLLSLGFAKRVPALRWSGLAIFLITLGKVFFVDMAQLPTAHRIGGFLVLGLLLLGASFLYQRARRDAEEDAASEET